MNTCKIGYNIIAKTAVQQQIVNDLSSAVYYEDRFSNAVQNLGIFCYSIHKYYIGIEIDYEEKRYTDGHISTTITWLFESEGGTIYKKKVKKFIYETIDKKLKEKGFHD